MDVVLQIFKRSICPGTPFFESLAKKPPTTMDDLFQRANKYSMLEDDVRAATQQVMVARQASRGAAERNAKFPDRPSRLSDFRWPRPQGTDPSTRDPNKRCVFHKEHGHTTETCRSLQYLVERLIKAGHLKQYLRSDAGGKITSQHHNPGAPRAPAAPKTVINYINEGPSDEEYDSKRKRQKLLRARITTSRRPHPVLEIGDFDVRRILVDPDSSANLVQASVVSRMGHSLAGLENPGLILAHMATLHESHPFYISSNGEFPHQRGQIDLYGSQLAARQCYQIAREAGTSQEDAPLPEPSHTCLTSFQLPDPSGRRLGVFTRIDKKVIRNEIDKLLEAGFIREVDYPDWLANVVVVPKKEGKWWVYVDYTNLNNACPKDSFPLSRIDQIVDSTAGQGMLSFLDAFSGYHQIPMSPAEEEKTAFITPCGLYCYKVMSFGLINASATYQRLMTKIFKPLIGHTVEVYIDDIVVKSKTREEHVLHLQEVFHLLRKYGMKLNPSKCAFGVSAGKFLGFMVSQRGIEVSPDQVKAVIETPPPRTKKELQRLTGKLVALGRFIARFTDELRPFFLAIRKAGANGWTDSCQNAFEKIKHCLMQPPILSSLIPKEKLYMYLAVSE
ncbi:Transposon Ty3-I Gag-Pol polyprotein [Vitis vinifera]|uniref:Transposon Ty3-I Gag-Pol polyprotein n=1 Tax=Vitis vinifera TaxID=29760 RepID=A0A438CTV3_VITVI|nr:Transposon Ty3-I Gag-Pol polyprotein [Vitis vinifera]